MAGRLRIVLDVDGDRGTLVGVATEGDGRRYPFTGWLGMLRALEALLPAGEPQFAAPPRPRPEETGDDVLDPAPDPA